MKKIRLIELFAGIGSQAMALKNLGVPFEHYRVVEFDKYPIKSYNAIHGTDFPTMDITQIKGDDLGIVETDEYDYLLTYSFPCFPKGTLVLTTNGYKDISDVVSGDKVLTHTNTYKSVLTSKCTGKKETIQIQGMAFDKLICTPNHKLYVRKLKRYYPSFSNGKRGSVRQFIEPEWIEAKNLDKSYYVGIAINNNNIVHKWEGVDFEWSDGRKSRHSDKLSSLMNREEFWYVMGSYIGDGWQRSQGGIIICTTDYKNKQLLSNIEKCGFNYSIVTERTVKKVHISIKELGEFCKVFGKGAKNKHIPSFMFDMPTVLIKAFIEGYMATDGYVTKNNVYKISSVSRDLIYGTAQLVAKAYKRPYSIYKTKRKSTCVIEGRTVNQNDSYTIAWHLDKRKQDKAFYENGYLWTPIYSIEENELLNVYDIEVEEDHSFTANSVIVHNCTDLSLAGKMQGMTKGSGTRSGLLWEVERLLNEVENLPQILLMENVPQVHSKKNMSDFQSWLDFLSSKGYKTVWQDLNAMDYGVAQSRKRCFAVSFLGNRTFEFPKSIPLTKTMKDYLENAVDEKYYLTNDKAKDLIDKLIIDGKINSKDNIGMQTVILKNMGTSNKDNIPSAKETNISCTLCARDYKGIANWGGNGVIECQKLK